MARISKNKAKRSSMFIVLDERPTFIKEIHFANDANDVALGILFLLRMPYVCSVTRAVFEIFEFF